MAIYFGTTEITKLRDLAPQSGLDITDIWLGETNVYTVWQTYEGTLPATIISTGDNLRQYQVWGNVGGVGDRTENIYLFNSDTVAEGKFIDANGNEQNSSAVPESGIRLNHTAFFSVVENQIYTFSGEHEVMGAQQTVAFIWYDENKVFISRTTTIIHKSVKNEKYNFNGTSPQNATYAMINFFTNAYNSCMIVEDSVVPLNYVPFGYEVDMSVSSGNLCYKEITGANIDDTVKIIADSRYNVCIFECTQGETYTIKNEDTVIVYAFFDSEPRMGSSSYDNARVVVNENAVSFTAPITGWCATRYIATNTSAMAVRGFAVPEKYQPYSNTTTPVYIGDDPLDKDEYIDYQAGKIYRMINGVLTPTDPPVPLPTLPTCEGETIIEYTGQSVALEKVLLKYRKEGF